MSHQAPDRPSGNAERRHRNADDPRAPVLWTRREFFPVAAAAMGLTSGAWHEQRSLERLAYIGTYTTDGRSEGIYVLRMHPETGALRVQGVAGSSEVTVTVAPLTTAPCSS